MLGHGGALQDRRGRKESRITRFTPQRGPQPHSEGGWSEASLLRVSRRHYSPADHVGLIGGGWGQEEAATCSCRCQNRCGFNWGGGPQAAILKNERADFELTSEAFAADAASRDPARRPGPRCPLKRPLRSINGCLMAAGETRWALMEGGIFILFYKKVSYVLICPTSPLRVPSRLIKNGKCQSGAGGTVLPGQNFPQWPNRRLQTSGWSGCWVFNYLLCWDYEERPIGSLRDQNNDFGGSTPSRIIPAGSRP